MPNPPRRFSIIIPVYCNEPSLRSLHERLCTGAAAHPGIEHEFIFVDDGSEDASFARLAELAASDPRARVVRLSRNFGSHNAYLAGLSVARGEWIAVIAADLQEPSDLPWRMLERWSPQTPLVLANRRTRDDDVSRALFSELYYRLMRRLAFPNIPSGGFDCFLIDRRVANELLDLNEPNPSVTGLVLWTGFTFAQVEYDRLARPFGRSSWTFTKRLKLFVDSVVAFSYAPVRAMSAIGVLVGLLGFLYAGWIVLWKLSAGIQASGWSSLMAALLVLSGIQLIALGVLGEYVWRSLEAARRRPNFLIAETRNVEAGPSIGADEHTARPSAVH